MKILHVVPYFYPAWAYGGPPRAVYEIAKEQQKAGHTVSVLTSTAYEKDRELPAGKTIIEGIEVTRAKNLSNWVMWNLHFTTAFGAAQYLRSHSFDVIHLHEARTLLNYLALKYGRTDNYCLSPWGTLPHNNSLVVVKNALDYLLVPLLQQKIRVAFAQTEHERKILTEYSIGSKRLIVPLGVNPHLDEKPLTKATARKKLSLERNRYYFLFLGRFSPHKGLRVLIEAFNQASKHMPRAKLLLVGRDDGYQKQLEALIASNGLSSIIELHAPLYDDDRYLAYRAADCFVFTPSVYEETGTVCLESLGSGTPVLTTEQAAIPFLDRADGVEQVSYDRAAITAALIALYTKTVQVNGDKFWKFFSWKRIVITMTESYNK